MIVRLGVKIPYQWAKLILEMTWCQNVYHILKFTSQDGFTFILMSPYYSKTESSTSVTKYQRESNYQTYESSFLQKKKKIITKGCR